ncbi:hypothetical protein [Maribacter sp. 2210JD10-5]|uniref:hypothetical protein n=1 Tax=Maribacter sp. 2210JD10-5 TaxID=3386272 RepID=UPI0039BD80E3
MYKTYIFFCVIALLLFSSFKTSVACEYAGSNIDFAKSQTKNAISKEDINQARFYAYKALNAIEKSKKQLAECACEHAEKDIADGINDLKEALKSTTLHDTRALLNSALIHTENTLRLLEEHDSHKSKYANDVLVLNTINAPKEEISTEEYRAKTMHEKIDASLEKYRSSLFKIVNTVDCKDAKAFAQRVFDHCEAQLLKENLTEGKKYYNLRTKEITAEALAEIGTCPSSENMK